MKKKLMLLPIILGMLVIVFASVTYSWFTAVKRTGNIRFILGAVWYELDMQNGFVSSRIIAPGEELVNQENFLNINNFSTINSSLRIKIYCSYEANGTLVSYEYQGLTTGHIVGRMSKDGTRDCWIYEDDYWYYYPEEDELLVVPPTEGLDSYPIPILESLYVNGNVVGNDTILDQVTIHLVFEARQYEYVTWQDLGSIDYNITG